MKKWVFNVFTGTFDLIEELINKLTFSNQNITVKTDTFLILHNPVLEGTATITVEGTGVLYIIG